MNINKKKLSSSRISHVPVDSNEPGHSLDNEHLEQDSLSRSKILVSQSGLQPQSQQLPVINMKTHPDILKSSSNQSLRSESTNLNKQEQATGLKKINDITSSARNFFDTRQQNLNINANSVKGSLSNLESQTSENVQEAKLGIARGVKVLPTSKPYKINVNT